MKKIVAWILALMMLLSCCAAQAEETKPLAGKKLTIALSPNFMFFETVSETDPTGYEGLDIDIIKELSDMLGFEFEIVPMSFSSLVGSLQANSVDMVISGMTSTEERQQIVDFSDVYCTSSVGCVVKVDAEISS
ncbi:MAG: transporter substrate-binding domain-containing protein [Eubacteriales bacterium]|nr:transporter substrate-binding domain-containing protein [Eubacteriales bacterium]